MSLKDQLLDMGFSTSLIDRCIKATGTNVLEQAIEWIMNHQNDPEPSQSSSSTDQIDQAAESGEIDASQLTAQSLQCQDCGKLFKDSAAAEFHAVKTSHQNFTESTEQIKPLTEEEKAAKLEALKQRYFSYFLITSA